MGQAQKVYVRWRDAHTINHGWQCPEDIKISATIVETVGWLLSDVRDNHLVVVLNNIDDEFYDSGIAIPIECVLELKSIRLGKDIDLESTIGGIDV